MEKEKESKKKEAPKEDKLSVIKNADMDEEMQHKVVELAHKAIKDFEIEKDIATFLKKECDQQFGRTWNCVVGRHFGSFVTYEQKNFIYLYMGQQGILLFKSA